MHGKEMTHIPKKLKLAYVSPLPPSGSGIADYSAMLLPALEKYYEIEVVVEHEVSDEWIKKTLPVRDPEWFKSHADEYDRVIYHIGNSSFHYYMFSLIERIPGIVVLHDFFLGHAVSGMDALGIRDGYWSQALYESHGLSALEDWFKELHLENLQEAYPVNKQILKSAYGVIVHTQQSKQLTSRWFEQNEAKNWGVIPLTRNLPKLSDSLALRGRYGFKQTDFLVCSFGMLGANKLNDRLLTTWLTSNFTQDASLQLIFVGENDQGDFGRQLVEQIAHSGHADHIKITGWVNESTYHDYLTMADIAVQLRGESRGEMSAAALDCMAYALPTIVNAQGGLAEISESAVCQLKADFSNNDLLLALNELISSKDRRQTLSAQARLEIEHYHLPQECAHQYAIHIESFYEEWVGKAGLLIASESAKALESKHWSLIKYLRQTHHDSEADLYLRMSAHHQMLEDQLAALNIQLDLTKEKHMASESKLIDIQKALINQLDHAKQEQKVLESNLIGVQKMLNDMQKEFMVAEVRLRHTTKAFFESEKMHTSTLKTLNDLVSSRSWRITMLIRHWVRKIKTRLFPLRESLMAAKAELKGLIKLGLNFFLDVLGSYSLSLEIKNQLNKRFPTPMHHLKLFLKSMPPSPSISNSHQGLSESEYVIYERLKLAFKNKSLEVN